MVLPLLSAGCLHVCQSWLGQSEGKKSNTMMLVSDYIQCMFTCGLLRTLRPPSILKAAGFLGLGVLGGQGTILVAGVLEETILAPAIVSTNCLNSVSSSGLNVTLSLCVSMILERRECGKVSGVAEVCPGTRDTCPRS